MKNKYLFSVLITLCLVSTAQADVYKCTDSAGRATYTNEKPKAGQGTCALLSRDSNISVINSGGSGRGSSSYKTPTPASFPRVTESTQKERDAGRLSILEQELTTEDTALTQAKKDLAEQEAIRLGGEKNYQRVIDRVQPYKDKVALHERNVEALRKEISTLK